MVDRANKFSNPHLANKSKMNKYIPIIIILIMLIGIFVLLHYLRWRGLEDSFVQLPSFPVEDTLKIPPRPGIQGIILSGPEIEDLVFQIDLSTPNLEELNWDELVAIDRNTDVKVKCFIDIRGKLLINKKSGAGHPSATKYIQNILSTWGYFPYKTGIIKFYFNAPSKTKKLIIDRNGLKKNIKMTEDKDVFNEIGRASCRERV